MSELWTVRYRECGRRVFLIDAECRWLPALFGGQEAAEAEAEKHQRSDMLNGRNRRFHAERVKIVGIDDAWPTAD